MHRSSADPLPTWSRRIRRRGPLIFSCLVLLLASAVLAPTPYATAAAKAPSSGAVVVDWNRELVTLVGTPGVQPATIHPTRSFAILQAAMYDAVAAAERAGSPYLFALHAPAGARADVAAAQAGHDTLAALYPAMKAAIDAQLAAELTAIPAGPTRDRGSALGRLVAALMLAARADDGSSAAPSPPLSSAAVQPGAYRPTPPFVAPGVFTQWSGVTPFVLRAARQFRPPAPPALASAAYARAINQVKSLGAVNSTVRTDEQTTIAKFWSGPIWITWNQIAERAALAHHTDLLHTARLFALLDLSLADTAIAMYDAKYHYNLWRPVTAIREAAGAGNPAVTADPGWAPLLTASDPSYPGAHSAMSAAGAAVLTAVYGPHDAVQVTSGVLPGVVRSFPSYSAAAREAGVSRIYAGVHTALDHTSGLRLGSRVAGFVLQRATSSGFGPG